MTGIPKKLPDVLPISDGRQLAHFSGGDDPRLPAHAPDLAEDFVFRFGDLLGLFIAASLLGSRNLAAMKGGGGPVLGRGFEIF